MDNPFKWTIAIFLFQRSIFTINVIMSLHTKYSNIFKLLYKTAVNTIYFICYNIYRLKPLYVLNHKCKQAHILRIISFLILVDNIYRNMRFSSVLCALVCIRISLQSAFHRNIKRIWTLVVRIFNFLHLLSEMTQRRF